MLLQLLLFIQRKKDDDKTSLNKQNNLNNEETKEHLQVECKLFSNANMFMNTKLLFSLHTKQFLNFLIHNIELH